MRDARGAGGQDGMLAAVVEMWLLGAAARLVVTENSTFWLPAVSLLRGGDPTGVLIFTRGMRCYPLASTEPISDAGFRSRCPLPPVLTGHVSSLPPVLTGHVSSLLHRAHLRRGLPQQVPRRAAPSALGPTTHSAARPLSVRAHSAGRWRGRSATTTRCSIPA